MYLAGLEVGTATIYAVLLEVAANQPEAFQTVMKMVSMEPRDVVEVTHVRPSVAEAFMVEADTQADDIDV
jgi:hypothetical protein